MVDTEDFFEFFIWFIVVGFIFGGVFSEVMNYIDTNALVTDEVGYFDTGCVIYILLVLAMLVWINLREQNTPESPGTERPYIPPKSSMGSEVEGRKCEEKWDGLCSGKGNVRHDGKWMCYHCQREHEQFWVYDDS